MSAASGAVPSAFASALGSRRMSQGNFAIVEEDDYSRAMSRLERAAAAAAATPPAAVGEGGGCAAVAAAGGGGAGAASFYWRSGPAADVSSLLRERAVARPRRHGSAPADGALTDANPPPAAASLAVPPPHAIMHPEGNSVVNSRIERCLAHNGVALAQTVAATRGALDALLEDAAFRAASRAVGFDPHELAAGTEGGGGDGGGEEQSAVSHLKHLALVLTEYRDMRLAGRVSAARRASVAPSRASGGAAGGSVASGARRARRDSAGGARARVLAAGGGARAALDARAASLADLGLAPAPGGAQPPHAVAPHASLASYGGSWADAASAADAPVEEAIEGGGGGDGGGGGGPEDDEAEAAELGLSVAQVAAARAARAAARATLRELEAAHAAIRDAARSVADAPRA